MSIYEYDEEEHMRMEREESWREGKREGLEAGELQGRIKMLIETYNEFGKSPEEIMAKLVERFQMSEEAAERYMEECL